MFNPKFCDVMFHGFRNVAASAGAKLRGVPFRMSPLRRVPAPREGLAGAREVRLLRRQEV